MTVYPDYFYSEKDFDKSHMGYKPLTIPAGVEAQPLAVPPLLAPDKVDGMTSTTPSRPRKAKARSCQARRPRPGATTLPFWARPW